MDISAGVLVREGKIIRRGPRQVERTVLNSSKLLDLKSDQFVSQAKRSLSRLALSHFDFHDLQCSFVFPTICALALFSIPLGTNNRPM